MVNGATDALLDAFEQEIGRFTAEETLNRWREIKLHVVAKALAVRRTVGGEKWLVVLALAGTKAVRSVLQRLLEDERRRASQLNDCAFVLEDVVMTAYHVLRSNSSDTDAGIVTTTAASASSSETIGVDVTLVCGAFARVLAFFHSDSSTCQLASVVWADVGLLLSLCWLQRDPQTRGHHALELLDSIVTTTERTHVAAWPLFTMALIYATVQRDFVKALACVREAIALASALSDHQESTGVMQYWYAVLLSKNDHATNAVAAIEQLRVAVRCNYHAIASLNLQALLALQANDLFAASEALERCIDIDFDQAVSMFNYALLLKRMANASAQYQMLEYYNEATTGTTSGDGGDSSTQDLSSQKAGGHTATLQLFPDEELSRLFPCQQTCVDPGTVALEMATAAMACGAWSEARERFEEYFTTIQDTTDLHRKTHQLAVRSSIYVLLQCNRPSEALAQCETASRTNSSNIAAASPDLFIELYKADALLCLERVDECATHLQVVVEPQLSKQRESASDKQSQSELRELHIQLVNNLAVAVVCRGEVDRAVAILRDCSTLYPSDVRVKFNLVLLLWRLDRKDAACSLWFQARGWSLRMDVSELREQHKVLDFVTRVEDEALSSASPRRPITSHVQDVAETSGEIDDEQLRYLDALILHHWSNAQSSQVAKTAAQYVEYLETVSTRVAGPHRFNSK